METSAPQPQNALVHRTVGGCEEFREIVEKYSWDSKVMLAIAQAESGCNPRSDNSELNADGTYDYGLFQINSVHGYNRNTLANPAKNTEIAFKIWQLQGYRAWSAYNNGSYLKFM
ncbi:MAG: transglycosylase SLT domain-containing protein [bacterium]|nr:transglycosylase SLT domain-containing protein [bacterium]